MNVSMVLAVSVLHTGWLRGPTTRYLRKLLAPRGSRGSRKSFMVEDSQCTQGQTLEMEDWRMEMETEDWRWTLRTGDGDGD